VDAPEGQAAGDGAVDGADDIDDGATQAARGFIGDHIADNGCVSRRDDGILGNAPHGFEDRTSWGAWSSILADSGFLRA